MTVTDLAKQLHASKPTIYARVKKAGYNWQDMRDSITGELTPQAVTQIASLFDDFTPAIDKADEYAATIDNSKNVEIASLTARIEGLTKENELLREIIKTKDAQIAQQQAQIEALHVDLDSWRQRVPIALPTPRPGFWERRRMKKALGESKGE